MLDGVAVVTMTSFMEKEKGEGERKGRGREVGGGIILMDWKVSIWKDATS